MDLGANESRCGQGLYWKKRRRGEEKREEMEEEEERASLYISFVSRSRTLRYRERIESEDLGRKRGIILEEDEDRNGGGTLSLLFLNSSMLNGYNGAVYILLPPDTQRLTARSPHNHMTHLLNTLAR